MTTEAWRHDNENEEGVDLWLEDHFNAPSRFQGGVDLGTVPPSFIIIIIKHAYAGQLSSDIHLRALLVLPPASPRDLRINVR